MGILKRKRSAKCSSCSRYLEALESRILLSVQTVAQYNFAALTGSSKTVADISNDGFTVQYATARTLSTDNPFGESGNKSISVTGDTGVIANHSTLNLNHGTNTFTIEGWIKPSSTTADYIAQLTNTSTNPVIALGTSTGGLAYARFRAGGTEHVIQAGTLTIGGWNYMALVYDGSAMHLYLKNSHYTTLTDVGNATVGATLPTGFATSANVATEATAGSANTALFDDIRISSTAATTAELGYNASFGAAAPAGYLDASTVGGGWNATDATAALQAALDTGENVWVPKEAGSWILDTTIDLTHSNQELQFDGGVVVAAEEGAFVAEGSALFKINTLNYVTIEGNGAQLKMNASEYDNPPYTDPGTRPCLQFWSCDYVLIDDVNIINAGGAGIALGQGGQPTNAYVTIQNCDISGCDRNGISVLTADHLTITNCILEANGPHAPAAGIDIEPDAANRILTNIAVNNSTFTNNNGAQIILSLGSLTSTSPAVSISFDNDITSDSVPGGFSNENSGICVWNVHPNVGGTITFTNMTINVPDGTDAIDILNKAATGALVSFGTTTGTVGATIEAQGSTYPIYLDSSDNADYGPFGGIDFNNITFSSSFVESGDFLYGLDGDATALNNIQGTFNFTAPGTPIYYLSMPQTNVNIVVNTPGAPTATLAQYDFDALTNGNKGTPDDSGNGFDLTFNQAVTTSTSTPFSPPVSGDNSMQMLNNNVGKITDLNMDFTANNSFTIEGWIEPTTVHQDYVVYLSGTNVALSKNTTVQLGMTTTSGHSGDGFGYMVSTGQTAQYLYSTNPLVLNAWNYLVLTYNGSTSTLTLSVKNSGTSGLAVQGSANITANLPSILTGSPEVATGPSGTLYDDVRISGAVLTDAELGYHGSFTGGGAAPPLAQYDFDSMPVVSGQDTTPDDSGNGYDVTWNHAANALVTDTNPFGNQSGDNSVQVKNDVGKAANFADMDLATTNTFTIEGWIDPSASGSVNKLVDMQDGGKYVTLEMNSNGTVYARIDSGTNYAISSTDALVNDAWNYLALTYDGSTLKLYLLNSNHPTLSLVGSVTPNVTLPSTLTYLQIATAGSTTTVLYDDIRISNVVLADAQLGYHGSFTGGDGPQLVRSAIVPATAAPSIGPLDATTASPDQNASNPSALTVGTMEAPLLLPTVGYGSAFATSAGHFKSGLSRKSAAITDIQGSSYFVNTSDATYYRTPSENDANITIGGLK